MTPRRLFIAFAVAVISELAGCDGDRYLGEPFPPQPDLSASVDMPQLDGNPPPADGGSASD